MAKKRKAAGKRSLKRTKKQAAKGAAATRAAPGDVTKVISADAFDKLMKSITGFEADKNEAVGSIGTRIGQAVEKEHLDKKAFGIFRSLHRMSDRKLATTLAHLYHYIDIGGVADRAERQQEIFARGETDPAVQEAGEAAPGKGKRQRKSGKDKNAGKDGETGKRKTFGERLREANPKGAFDQSPRGLPPQANAGDDDAGGTDGEQAPAGTGDGTPVQATAH